MPYSHPVTINDKTVVIHATCRSCKESKDIEVDSNKYFQWLHGEYIQVVLPELSTDDRELLISGICGPCFDEENDMHNFLVFGA